MPTYEYRCRDCDQTFELHRSMADSATAAACPQGHENTVKLLTTVAVGGSSATTAGEAAPAASGGGCCGGGCCA